MPRKRSKKTEAELERELVWDEEEFDSFEDALLHAIDSNAAKEVASNSYDDYGMGGGCGLGGIYEWQGKFIAYMPESGFSVHSTLKDAFADSAVCGLGGLNQQIWVDLEFKDLIEHYRRQVASFCSDQDARQVFTLNGVCCAIRERGLVLTYEEFFSGHAMPTTGGESAQTFERIARRPDGRLSILIESEAEATFFAFVDLSEDELDAWIESRSAGDEAVLERRRSGLAEALGML